MWKLGSSTLTRPGAIALLALTAALMPAAPAEAQSSEEVQEGWVWHVVKEGETLQSITADYLGDARLWRNNWRLNPRFGGPRCAPTRSARSRARRSRGGGERVARRVEEKRPRRPWQPTQVGARLGQGDGLRTREQASAGLLFDDESRVVGTENSLLFLRSAVPSRSSRSPPRSRSAWGRPTSPCRASPRRRRRSRS